MVSALHPPKHKEEGKVQLDENAQVEQDPGNGTKTNANSLSQAENIARARESRQFAVTTLKEGKQNVVKMIERVAKENSAETGMGADLLELYQRYEAEWAEQDEANSADENAELIPAETHRVVLSQMLDTHIELFLKPMKKQLEILEAAQEASEPASLLLLPPESQDRIHRAETPLGRHLRSGHFAVHAQSDVPGRRYSGLLRQEFIDDLLRLSRCHQAAPRRDSIARIQSVPERGARPSGEASRSATPNSMLPTKICAGSPRSVEVPPSEKENWREQYQPSEAIAQSASSPMRRRQRMPFARRDSRMKPSNE